MVPMCRWVVLEKAAEYRRFHESILSFQCVCRPKLWEINSFKSKKGGGEGSFFKYTKCQQNVLLIFYEIKKSTFNLFTQQPQEHIPLFSLCTRLGILAKNHLHNYIPSPGPVENTQSLKSWSDQCHARHPAPWKVDGVPLQFSRSDTSHLTRGTNKGTGPGGSGSPLTFAIRLYSLINWLFIRTVSNIISISKHETHFKVAI